MTCVIAGATKKEQVVSNAEAMKLNLEEDQLKELTAVTEDLKVAMGKNADMWWGVEKSRVD